MSSNGGCEINAINMVNDGSGQSIDKPGVLLDDSMEHGNILCCP
jgi:hypothetical protein